MGISPTTLDVETIQNSLVRFASILEQCRDSPTFAVHDDKNYDCNAFSCSEPNGEDRFHDADINLANTNLSNTNLSNTKLSNTPLSNNSISSTTISNQITTQDNCEPLGREQTLDVEVHPPWTWDIHIREKVVSTNQVVWELISGESHLKYSQFENWKSTVVIAHEQTRGKGQWSRQWLSHPGGLYLSASLPCSFFVETTPLLTFAIAWGIASAIRACNIPVRLKWPNDLVVNGKKLGGILIETRIRGERIPNGVIGVGINWMNKVPDIGITLYELLKAHFNNSVQDLNDVAALVLLGIQRGFNGLSTYPSTAIVDAYKRLWIHEGQWIQLPDEKHMHRDEQTSIFDDTANHHSNQRIGKIIGVNSSGSLIVQIPATHNLPEQLQTYPPGTIAIGYRHC